ncbi:MAG: fibronectin type III domain-containing protein, partial [Capsulimonadaceae bacterium]
MSIRSTITLWLILISTALLSAHTAQAGVPGAPSGVTATPGNAQVSLAWSAASGATSYNVYRGTAAGGESATPVTTGITTTTDVDTGLTNGSTYYYKLSSVNSSGTSGLSGEVSATPNALPAVPAGLTAKPGNTEVSLSWTESSGATSYSVYRGTASGGESATAIATNVTTVTYENGGLTNGVAYYFKVAAVNSGGTSAQSNEASGTPVVAPGAPTGVTATAGNAQVALAWTAGTSCTSYNVYIGTAAGGESATPEATGITATNYTDSGVANGTKYYYKLAGVNASGTSGMSSEVSATPTAGVPAAPTGLTASAGNAQVSLSWTASSGATSYNVYRGTASGGESTTAIATGITTTSFTNTGLT